MASQLLSLAQDICDDPGMNLSRPMSLFGTYDEGDTTDRRLVRAFIKTCQAIAGRYEWQTLKSEFTFTTVAAEVQPGALPADLLRVVQDTMWGGGLIFTGPINDADWAAMRSGRLPQAYPAFRIYGDAIHMWPIPDVGQIVTYQYISNAVGTSAPVAGVRPRIARFAADTDTALWDDELMTLGAILQYRKGLRKDYAQDQIDFEGCLANRIKADGGSKVLAMGGMSSAQDRGRRPTVTLTTTQPKWGGSDW